MNPTRPRRIGFLGYDGVVALDIAGASEAFASTRIEAGGVAVPAYEIVLLSVTGRRFVAESGIVFEPHRGIQGRLELDTLIVPGGFGLREPATNARVAAFLAARAPKFRRVATVCTGIYALAASGLLDGRRVTTHWRFARDVAARFPKLVVVPDALFSKDGPYYTSAGVTAGIDLALALVEEDHGSELAHAVAGWLVVFTRRPGGQSQFSARLSLRPARRRELRDLQDWLPDHLCDDLSVAALARRAGMSERTFARAFQAETGTTPAAYVEGVRLEAARELLEATELTVAEVARRVGLRSPERLHRAVRRRLGTTPDSYRQHFARSPAAATTEG